MSMDNNVDVQSSAEPIGQNFDSQSGTFVERILFNNRPIILLICFATTIFLGSQALNVRVNADFDKMIPVHQPLIVNFLKHYDDLQSQENAIRIVVQADKGTIINANYLETLQQINDQVYLLPNVDRAFMTSLWTPSTRWTAVTADGITSAPVIGQSYDGSPQQLQTVATNIGLTGKIGSLVSNDFTSSTIYVPLIKHDGLTGSLISYGQLSREMDRIRAKYAQKGVKVYVVGFAMVVGDMIRAMGWTILFFGVSALIATSVLFWFTLCVRSTILVVCASVIAVVWQMGILVLLSYQLTPYSVLVPFLVFAIGMSHGAQKMNGVMQDIGRGAHPLVAARFTFRRLFLAGFAALVCDASSFAVLMAIKIDAIRELALFASFGVGILIFTNLIMLPIMLSYTGVSKEAAIRSLRNESSIPGARIYHPVWAFLDKFTVDKRYAIGAIAGALVLGLVGLQVGSHVQVGDLNKGAPELRQSSQYNRDSSYINSHYSVGDDTMIAMMDTVPNGCLSYQALSTLRRLGWTLNQLPEVQSTSSLGSFTANLVMMFNENLPKWYDVVRNQPFLGSLQAFVPDNFMNFSCSFDPMFISLRDHKAATLTSVLNAAQAFIDQPANQSSGYKITLAGGNAGVEAATNIVIARANELMLFLVYATVIVFCFIVLRSWRAVLCAVLPLILTSILAQALMVILGIGITVGTLPVVALGVGIGVDYALYVLSIVIKHMRAGESLSEAYYRTLLFTGRVVLLTGFTLAAGVVTWVAAPIKFQADMGLLLSFMFLWNMLGALLLLPALAYFLLPQRLFHAPIGGGELIEAPRP
jgi:predicted RND superfamily exporter protein